MQPRIDIARVSQDAYKAMLGPARLRQFASAWKNPLLELVKIRASQINGCAFCLHMHTRDARKAGESQERLDLLGGLARSAGLFTSRERAALAWTEAVTHVADTHVPDEVYDAGADRILRAGTGRSDHGGGGHQRLEPADGRVPNSACRLAQRLIQLSAAALTPSARKAAPSRIVMRTELDRDRCLSRRRCASTRHTVSIVRPR